MECASLRNTATVRAPLLSLSDPFENMNERPSFFAAVPAVVMVASRTCLPKDSDWTETVAGLHRRQCGLEILPGQRVSSGNNMPPAHMSPCGSSQKHIRKSAATSVIDGFGLSSLPAITTVVSLGIVIFASLALYGARQVVLVTNLMLMGVVQASRRAQLPQPGSRRATSWCTLNTLGGGPRCFLAPRCFVAFSLHHRPVSWVGLARLGRGPASPCRDDCAALDGITTTLHDLCEQTKSSCCDPAA